jgi:hypothetical protein
VPITVKLTDNITGKGIYNAIVNININGINYSSITNSDGMLVYNFTPTKVGRYTVFASFMDNDNYNVSNSTHKILTVNNPYIPTPPDSNDDDTNNSNSINDSNDGLLNGNNLFNTGFPLIVLLILSINCWFIWRRK